MSKFNTKQISQVTLEFISYILESLSRSPIWSGDICNNKLAITKIYQLNDEAKGRVNNQVVQTNKINNHHWSESYVAYSDELFDSKQAESIQVLIPLQCSKVIARIVKILTDNFKS